MVQSLTLWFPPIYCMSVWLCSDRRENLIFMHIYIKSHESTFLLLHCINIIFLFFKTSLLLIKVDNDFIKDLFNKILLEKCYRM